MKILVTSKINQDSIEVSLGKPEYSYYFLLKEFLPALRRVGKVAVVESAREAQRLCRRRGRLLISVSPPHQTPLTLPCPTLTLFAWEFDTLPDSGWDDTPGNDWRHVFANTAGAICTSRETAELVREVAGNDYPVIALPAPVWDRYAHLAARRGEQPQLAERFFAFSGAIIDSPILGLSADGLVTDDSPPHAVATAPAVAEPPPQQPAPAESPSHDGLLRRALRALRLSRRPPPPPPAPQIDAATGVIRVQAPFWLQVSGVVFTTLLNPGDSRKNWIDIITAFCWAFRERPDATLILKMTHHDIEYYRLVLVTLLSRLSPFACRVVVLHGFMRDEDYAELIAASTFYVNASSGEGLCLPLMEFLSAGVPAIAPTHTAMADYVDDSLALTVKCSPEPFCWPHDPSGVFATHRHRLNWQSLMEAFEAGYALATQRPADYREMSRNATRRLGEYASVAAVSARLAAFLPSVTKRAGARSGQ